MSIFDDAFSFAEHVGGSMVNDTAHLAEDGYKLATDSNYREQAWHSALNHVKAAANFGKAAIRSVDGAKDQLGSMINSGEQYLEKKVDDGRAWLRQHGGVAGQVLSDQVGFDEGIASSLYGAGKGLVQLADGVSSLTNPVEWAVNPDANIGRIKSAVNSAESLGKIAGLADPANWMARIRAARHNWLARSGTVPRRASKMTRPNSWATSSEPSGRWRFRARTPPAPWPIPPRSPNWRQTSAERPRSLLSQFGLPERLFTRGLILSYKILKILVFILF